MNSNSDHRCKVLSFFLVSGKQGNALQSDSISAIQLKDAVWVRVGFNEVQKVKQDREVTDVAILKTIENEDVTVWNRPELQTQRTLSSTTETKHPLPPE